MHRNSLVVLLFVTASAAPAAALETAKPARADAMTYYAAVDTVMVDSCAECHDESEGINFALGATPQARFEAARAYVEPNSPEGSQLYTLPLDDDNHDGGEVYEAGSEEATIIAAWINSGALFAEGDAPKAPMPAHGGKSPHPEALGDGTFVGNIPKAKSGAVARFNRMLDPFQINGRFDINYERRNYSGNPFDEDATDALISYHNFVFLSRQAKDDPWGFTAEITSLQFWEAYYHREEGPNRYLFKFGKLLVPFGPEPTYHKYYGGLVAFDQRVLPAIWAQEGVSFTYQHRMSNGFTFNNDLYAVRGYQLRNETDELDLRSDFSPTDNSKVAFGDRIGLSYGPVSAWYSIYGQTLGFGRTLLMQAVDLQLWRIRGVPVLDRLTLGAGALRADVSNGEGDLGGAGDDYYHFASYFQAQFFFTNWLYARYRQGLRTFGNRDGLFFDERLYTTEDASTQNVGLVARFGGFSAAIFHFWNFEKIDEQDNDFLRMTVAYEF